MEESKKKSIVSNQRLVIGTCLSLLLLVIVESNNNHYKKPNITPTPLNIFDESYASNSPETRDLFKKMYELETREALKIIETTPSIALEFQSFSDKDIYGLRMMLPKEFTTLNKKVTEHESYFEDEATMHKDTRGIIIKRFRPKVASTNDLSHIADLIEESRKNLSGYISERIKFNVNGTEGLILLMKFNTVAEGVSAIVQHSILTFEKEGILWEIQIFGVNDADLNSLLLLQQRIFKSVSIMD